MPHCLKLVTIMMLALVVSPASTKVDDMHRRANSDFISSVQHQLNPDNKDLGQQLQVSSQRTFQGTLGNTYFWITGLSLGTSALLCWYIAFLIQQRQRREIISAKLLAWYHNDLVCARQSARSITALSSEASSHQKEETPPDALSELSRLRQQVASQDGTEKILRAQINALTRKLADEKHKNKSLKPE